MSISVIVPVYNNPQDLVECVAAIEASAPRGTEIIVVDDASTDDTALVAVASGARVFKLEKNSGPAAARNHGAGHARGEILMFVDADVVLAPGAIERITRVFEAQPDLAAVFGSYDAKPRAPELLSQYRNLLHHFVHQNGNPDAATFWAGCGAIRRSAFEQVGGFDEKRFPQPSIEDIELGYRLRIAGYKILLDKSLQGKHLKHWNFRSLVHTDIFRRAIPWSRLILESKTLPNDLNLKTQDRASCALAGSASLFLGLTVLWPPFVGVSAAGFLGLAFLNRKLYSFFFRQRGLWFALACFVLHVFYYLYSGASYGWVWSGMGLKRVVKLLGYNRIKAGQPAS
jgi:GT2 family glycosyltransferase